MTRTPRRISVTLIIVAAFLLGLGVMALRSVDSPVRGAAQFMEALAKGDVPKLASLSYAEDVPSEELLDQWKYTMEVISPHYQFSYEIKGSNAPTKNTAIVWMNYVRNAGGSGSYDEKFELPMVKTAEGWKVEVYSMNREMFPGLPRG